MTDDDRRLLPYRPASESETTSPRILDLTSEEADLVFDALSSATARRILGVLYDEPATPPEIAAHLDLSLQNVHYHLRNMRDAELIEEIDTGYSEKGVEMSIYAPTADPVVLSDGGPEEHSRLRSLFEQLVGVVVVFGLVSALAHWLLTRDRLVDGPASPDPTPTPVPGVFGTQTPPPTPTPAPTVDPGSVVPPGVLFFGGGVVMVVILAGWWNYRRHRR